MLRARAPRESETRRPGDLSSPPRGVEGHRHRAHLFLRPSIRQVTRYRHTYCTLLALWYHWPVDHRVRLTDEDLALIVAALRSRAAMTSKLRRHRVERLASRLAEMSRGNPKWLLDEYEQTHEEDLDSEEE